MTTATTPLAIRKDQPPKTARDLVDSPGFQAEVGRALPAGLTASRFCRLAATSLNRVPELASCTLASLAQCLLDCAQLGLEPGGPLGRAYLIPFRDHKKGVVICTLIIGYRGLMELAYRSSKVKSIRAEVVRQGDEFVVEYGLEERLMHRPDLECQGELTHVYAIARMDGGSVAWTVMTRAQVEAIRKRSKASATGPWSSDYDEMARQTVLRRLLKQLPMASEADRGIEAEDVSHQNAGVYDSGIGALLAPTPEAPQVEPSTPAPEQLPEQLPLPEVKGDPEMFGRVCAKIQATGLVGAKLTAAVRRAGRLAGVTLPSELPSLDELPEAVLAALDGDLE